MTDEIIGSDSPFSQRHRATLQRLAGEIIPASADYAIPGADDERIFADFLATGTRHARGLEKAVLLIDELARGSLLAADPTGRQDAVADFCRSALPEARAVIALLVQCYYRDDRVMASLDMEPRAPHPQGFDVEEGDWGLLDPVRARGKIYKEV